MQIYLPVAEMSVSVLLLLAVGGAVGFLSGLFGVGGGFLMTPLLMFIGIPPAVAVATGVNQVLATSVSGVLAHWRRGNVDFKMGGVLLAGGLVGSAVGAWAFAELKRLGQVEILIGLSYVIFLGAVGALMVTESANKMLRVRRGRRSRGKLHEHNALHGLPFKMRFRKSKLYISALLPLAIGFFIGLLAAVMGVGGGFILVPAMIYLLGMPTAVVIGTSLFQITFVTANVTVLHAVATQTVDIVLALLLLLGGVVGAQFGSRLVTSLRGEQLRGLLGLLVLGVGLRLAWDLIATPDELFTLDVPSLP